MQEHVKLEVSLEIIMAQIAQKIFELNQGETELKKYELQELIKTQEQAYKGNRKSIEKILNSSKKEGAN